MKKLTASVLLIAVFASLCTPILAIDVPQEEIKTVESVIDVPVGTEVDAVFVCGDSAEKELTLKHGKETVASMNDNGKKGDAKKNDGILSAKVKLFSDERCTENYFACADDGTVTTYTVNYYNELTADDFAVKDAVKENVEKIEKNNEAKGKDAVYDAIYTYLYSCPEVSSVERTETSISYTTQAGITAVYTDFDDGTKGTGSVALSTKTNETVKTENIDDILSWTNPNVLVMRPFRNSISDVGAGFHEDVYISAAKQITNITGGKTIIFDDEEANPYNFAENLDKVGFFLIDSHGLDLPINGQMNSLIIMENVNNDGITSADWSAGRVVDINNEGLVGVSGEYIRAHYTEENRKLENTVCYMGICLGMKYDSIKVPLTDMGARCVIGYTETVSTYYDNNMLLAIAEKLSKTSDTSSERTCTVAESIEYAKEKIGDVDPGPWGARIEFYGSADVSLLVPDNRATAIEFSSQEYDASVNNSISISIAVRANDSEAYGYTQEWSSSDENIVQIVGPRIVKGVSEGTATVTCKISGEGYSFEKSCKVNVKYVSAEKISLNLDKKSLYASMKVKPVCTIYPRNASNKDYVIKNVNNGVVKLSKGIITAIAPGNTTVYADTLDGKLHAEVNVTVSKKRVFMAVDTLEYGKPHAFFSANSNNTLIGGKLSNHYMQAVEVEWNDGYITNNVLDINAWIPIVHEEGFYIQNMSTGEYLTMNASLQPELTGEPSTVFILEGKKIKSISTDSDTCYLRYKEGKGYCFGTLSQAAKFSVYKLLDYGNKDVYKEVSFNTGEKTYKQDVEIGMHAVNVCPMERSGYTFIGWDKPLSNVTESFETNAIYRKGTTDKVVITFMYTDGTVITTLELNENAKVEYPEAEDERNGMQFAGWSEDITRAETNMTVFALYENAVMKGDVTNDGKVNTSDAVFILRFAAGLVQLTEAQQEAAEVTHDGTVNTADAVAVLRFAAGMINEF